MVSDFYAKIKQIVRDNPNNMALGSAIRAFVISNETHTSSSSTNNSGQVFLEDMINEVELENRSNKNDIRL